MGSLAPTRSLVVDEVEILLEGCRFDRAAGLRLLERESFAQVEEPVGGNFRRSVHGLLAGVVDDEPALQVRAGVDLRAAIAALQPELPS
jgi:hypothetical protein